MEEPRETGNIPERLPRIPLIAAISIIFVLSVGASLWGMKVFSPEAIRRAALPEEKPDPLREALREMTSGLTNIELLGREYYNYYCEVCHGGGGKGDGFNAFNLDPRPADLTRLKAPNDHLVKAISEGSASVGGSPLCPPWGLTLSEDAINSIILYISTFAEKPSPG
ncbi:MAG: c-type cytochrome [Candidatus Brocadiales bacterium]